MSQEAKDQLTTPGRAPKSLASELIAAIGPRLGITVELEPKYRHVGQLVLPDGRKVYFRNTNFDLNGQGSAEIAKDKDFAAFFMKSMGYPTPKGGAFFSNHWCRTIGSNRNIDAAYRYAKRLGLPVFLKPNSKSQGSAVARVYTKQEFYQAARRIFKIDRVALVQQPVEGDDYRIVALDDEVISAYRRLPLSVVGDGNLSVEQLLYQKQEQFIASGRDTHIPFDDKRIALRLKRQHMNFNTVLESGERVYLLDNANLSSGGDAEDVTEAIHPTYKDLAVKVTRDLGLRYCGVDLITSSPIQEPARDYTILEVNAAPGLDNYAQVGEKQYQRVESMYEKILLALLKR